MSLIEVQGVSKSFRLQAQPKLIREHLRDRFRRSNDESATELFALRDVSFTVERGESLALVGRNGAGKSTLLSLVAGVAEPDAGRVTVTGRIAALLALGSGFHPDLTGRENMMLNAALLGFSEQQARQLFPRVVEFAELQEFIDEPMRSYSAGMTMRLAFAIAIQLDPDVLILDEVLAVGDVAFQGKCQQAINALRERGRTLFLVSHSPQMVLAFCDKAVWLEQGQVVRHGPARDVVTEYTERLSAPDRSLPARQDKPVETAVPRPNLRPAKSAVGGRRG